MLSFPYNSSSPILYYNKDIFQKAGLDVDNPPKTWPEVWEAAKKIKTSGAAPCGYTSAWLTWIHTENFAAWNNLQFGTNENGIAGNDVELKINSPIFVKHFQEIADLAKDGTFKYGGRTSEAKPLFLSGECGIYTEFLGRPRRRHQVGHELRHRPVALRAGRQGRAAEHHPRRRQPVGFRRPADEQYKGVAAFFTFLSQTPVQAKLHQVSGYLPVTMAAYEETKKSGFYDKNPAREIPIHQMLGKAPTENSKGVRLVNLPQVRDIENEEFEKMLAGDQTAQQALDNAVTRGNAAIKEALGN